ncbi:rod shape-determining protein MreC [Peptostreptococcaceae bacterium]|uniref:rod shape-determining protein MreC n=1 Tax=Peptacetobacter sp. AB845 TaxID=3388429 RepID=UPI0015BF167C
MKFDKFKKKKINSKMIATVVVAIVLVGFVGVSVIKYSGASPVSVGVVSDGVAGAASPIDSALDFIKQSASDLVNFKKNSNKMRELEKENEELKAKVIDLNSKAAKVESLESLKKSLNYISTDRMKSIVSGSVIEKNDGNWYKSFVLNVGEKDGVEKNSIVINGKGLVGIVYEVSGNSCKAISLLDSKSAVSFKIVNNTAAKGVISTSTSSGKEKAYESNGYLNGYMFDSGYEVVQGDIIVTSGMGLYPEDIPIGEIEKVIDDKNKSLKSVVIKPYVNFKDVNDVMIIKPRNIG